MSTKPIARCIECRVKILPRSRRSEMTPETRSQGGRGMCSSCYSRHRRNGTLIDIERTNRPTEEVVEEWEHLADPTRPVIHEIARLAPQFGMTEDALEGALFRGGIRSRFEPAHKGNVPKGNSRVSVGRSTGGAIVSIHTGSR